MLKKIVTDGDTVEGRAAVAAAKKLDIDISGHHVDIESDPFIPSQNTNVRTVDLPSHNNPVDKHILESDGTVIFYFGTSSNNPEFIVKLSQKHARPCLALNLSEMSEFDASQELSHWTIENDISIMNIAGIQRKSSFELYQAVLNIIESAVFLGYIEESKAHFAAQTENLEVMPQTAEQAVAYLIKKLPLKDRIILANMTETELSTLDTTLGEYIRREFGLWTGNTALMESCNEYMPEETVDEASCSSLIIHGLWEKLRQTHVLRVIK